MDEAGLSWADVRRLDIVLFRLGGADITLFTMLMVAALGIALVYLANRLRSWTVSKLLASSPLDQGTRQAIGAIVRYCVLAIGFLAIVQTLGINLTTFNVLAGAVAVGIGFGLQNIVNNFVSGLIIMFERPIKVGDRIEITNVEGEVRDIGARRTAVLTNDNVTIIVPNQRFIMDNVVNLRYLDAPIRMRLPVAVHHAADAEEVARILTEVARANPAVLPEPPPAARLLSLSGSLQFELQVWSRSHLQRKDELVSALNFEILRALRANDLRPA